MTYCISPVFFLVFNTYKIFTYLKIFFYSSYSETNTEPIKGEMGISLEMEETMKNMKNKMKPNKRNMNK